jgi:PAS domain S-box-containing protein
MQPKLDRMIWLTLGIVYSLGYVLVGLVVQGHPDVVPWFRLVALLVPPLAGVWVIASRRGEWIGCQWLFWATIALGLAMAAVGVVGWTADELLLGSSSPWTAWHSIFSLFGGVAPLFALLAQPHRGTRDGMAPTTAVDIAGVAVLTGFLYTHFVVGPAYNPAGAEPMASMLMVSELQQLLACIGMMAAALVARDPGWRTTYWRLALGLLVSFVTFTVTNAEIWGGLYRNASVYDVAWILPFAFYPWAAMAAPSSVQAFEAGEEQATPSRPWVIFGGLALVPLIDYSLSSAAPTAQPNVFHDLSAAVTIVSVLPLLMARLAVERAEVRRAGSRLRILEAAIEQAEEQVLILAPDGRIQHANAAVCRATGYAEQELIGRSSESMLPRGSAARATDNGEVTRRRETWRGTLTRQRKDGSGYKVSSVVVPLFDERRQITHWVAVERDISEEVRLREQLIHSERLSAVGQLVSGVAHELNNPLQSVLGFAELLMEGEQRPQARHDLEQVRSEAIRAGKIVRNLLAFVRRSSPERFVSDLNEIVRKTLALRSYEFASARIRLEEEYQEALPAVLVNPEEIQQVILNLVLNAEYVLRSGRQGGTLTVRTGAVDGGAIVEICDDGPGVPPDLAGRVFEPFFSTKDVGEGTGLGLSIALGIAEAHGGTLKLMPTNVGASFRLTLPFVTTREMAASGRSAS